MASSTALGQYLRARRELVRPEDVSSDYYLRLEQGRDHHPSGHVIDALARALRLDEAATAHLRSLSQPAAARLRTEEPERAPDPVIRLIGSWSTTPAFVQGRHMDVLAANALASAVSPVFSPGVNIVQATFLDPEVRRLVGDDAWDDIAHHAVARLRALAGPDVDDPGLDELVGELSARSDRFRRLWARHDIEVGGTPVYTFNHPLVGAFTVNVDTRRPSRPRRTPTTCSVCSRPSPPGTATPSRCTTPPSGPRMSGQRWPRRSSSPRPRFGSTRRTWAAGSGRACASGRTCSWRCSPPARSGGRSSWSSPGRRCSPASATAPTPSRHSGSASGATASLSPSTTRRPTASRWRTRTPSRSHSAAPAGMPARTSPPATGSGG